MMNKIKTTRVHLIRFLFVLPLLTIVLLSFRSSYPVGKNKPGFSMKDLPGFIDTVPGQTTQNTKGFYIDIKDNKGNCTVVVKDRDSKEVKRMLLTEWNKKEKYYEDLYGEILSPPSTCDVPATEPIPAAPASPATLSTPSAPATPAVPAKLPVRLKNIAFGNDSNKPLTIVDGVEWPVELDMNIIDAAKIENVSVLKNESATDKYHDKGKNGVVIISTKKQAVANPQTAEIRIRKAGIPGNALYYLNDKQTTKEAVDLLDPNKIKSIDVLKGSKAEQKYGEKGKNGVIEIRTFTPPETNFIEKRNFPDWDIRNILVGKKKDEC